jgi:8-oxo-dGTP pyrophosphatase MutT (NUDIX family)
MNEIAVPRPAATILLLRQRAAGIEVLMTKRHTAAGFAAGALVFPGGKVDAADAALLDRARGLAERRLPAPPFWVAGVRETFEECGLLLARHRGEEAIVAQGELDALVEEHGGGPAGFARLLEAGEHELATDLLVPFSHWITPKDRPKRFDTHFFLAPAPDDQEPLVDGHEATELVWVDPSLALEEADAGRYSLVFATRLNLWRLAQSRTIEAAMAAARESTIVTVCPELVERPDGPYFRVPEDAGYGAAEFPAAKIPRA